MQDYFSGFRLPGKLQLRPDRANCLASPSGGVSQLGRAAQTAMPLPVHPKLTHQT